MITFIYGENNYQARQVLNRALDSFEDKNAIERLSGEALSSDQLPDILRGASLFSARKLVIMSGLAVNKTVWADLAGYLADLSDELELVILEDSPDKRTKTYKLLQKLAQVYECRNLTQGQAIKWLEQEAKKRSLALSPADTHLLVGRAGLDQWQLYFALEKLAGFEEITADLIQDLVEAAPQASAFALIDAALTRQPEKVLSAVKVLRASEDAYFFFGLLAGQVFQLITLASTKKSPSEVASDLGVHPYPLQKMHGLARRLSRSDLKAIAAVMAECDNQLKRSGVEPWLILEQALIKLAAAKKS